MGKTPYNRWLLTIKRIGPGNTGTRILTFMQPDETVTAPVSDCCSAADGGPQTMTCFGVLKFRKDFPGAFDYALRFFKFDKISDQWTY